jgi:hypothetical protein
MSEKHSLDGKLELIAKSSFAKYDDMYKIVDFLNKSLKEKNVIFGLTLDEDNNRMSISIYEI